MMIKMKEMMIINRGFVIKKNLIEENHKEEVDDNDNKTTDGAPIQHEHKMHKIRNLLSKNFPYNKPKPSNKIGNSYTFKSKKSGEENKNLNKKPINSNNNNPNFNDDAISVSSFNKINTNMNVNNNIMMNSPRTTAGYMNEGNDMDNNNYARNYDE